MRFSRLSTLHVLSLGALFAGAMLASHDDDPEPTTRREPSTPPPPPDEIGGLNLDKLTSGAAKVLPLVPVIGATARAVLELVDMVTAHDREPEPPPAPPAPPPRPAPSAEQLREMQNPVAGRATTRADRIAALLRLMDAREPFDPWWLLVLSGLRPASYPVTAADHRDRAELLRYIGRQCLANANEHDRLARSLFPSPPAAPGWARRAIDDEQLRREVPGAPGLLTDLSKTEPAPPPADPTTDTADLAG